MKNKTLNAIILCAAAVGYNTAYAASCGTTGGLDTTDVTFRGSEADGCAGLLGNKVNLNGNGNALSVNNPVLFSLDGGNWAAELKDDAPGGNPDGSTSYLGFNWLVSADAAAPVGNWLLTLANPNNLSLPVSLDILVLLKASDDSAGYLFNDEVFSITGPNAGTFAIKFDNNGGNYPDLSHLTLFLRQGKLDENIPTIPEPGTLALLGFGVMGMGMRWSRKPN